MPFSPSDQVVSCHGTGIEAPVNQPFLSSFGISKSLNCSNSLCFVFFPNHSPLLREERIMVDKQVSVVRGQLLVKQVFGLAKISDL